MGTTGRLEHPVRAGHVLEDTLVLAPGFHVNDFTPFRDVAHRFEAYP